MTLFLALSLTLLCTATPLALAWVVIGNVIAKARHARRR